MNTEILKRIGVGKHFMSTNFSWRVKNEILSYFMAFICEPDFVTILKCGGFVVLLKLQKLCPNVQCLLYFFLN